MEGLKKAVGDAMGKNEYSSCGISKAVAAAATSNNIPPSSSSSSSSSSSTYSSYDGSRLLLNRSPRQLVSLWTCSKLCAFSFVAGILVGFTLKRRLRRWASSLLRRLKDD